MTAIHWPWQIPDTRRAASQAILRRLLPLALIPLALLASCSWLGGMISPPVPSLPSPPLPPLPAPPPTSIEPRIVASRDINPGSLKHASPVVVRVYELKSATAFERAAFFALFDSDKETLGADLLAREEFVVQPGAIVYVPRRAPDGSATVLGVVAAFQSLDTATWRAAVPIKPHVDNRYTVHLDGTSLTLVGQP